MERVGFNRKRHGWNEGREQRDNLCEPKRWGGAEGKGRVSGLWCDVSRNPQMQRHQHFDISYRCIHILPPAAAAQVNAPFASGSSIVRACFLKLLTGNNTRRVRSRGLPNFTRMGPSRNLTCQVEPGRVE